MKYGLIDIFEVLGSLVLFLYGMKLMSESLQKAAGEKMRAILAAMTSNRFRGILTGVLITAVIQSSSATTVMVVSFVNAGLITLAESIGVIMGANIGTTVTAWLVSLLGLKIEISKLVLPLMGIALPMIFSSRRKLSSWGGVIMGFAILFIGLDFLAGATPDVSENPDMLAFITRFSNFGFVSVIIFMLIGMLFTMIVQSSSAAMAVTLVMCFNGWISFDMAIALVLGQNIGTTITANLAALVANASAKRAARAHFLFNAVGVLLVIIFFKPFLGFIDWITVTTGAVSPYHPDGHTSREVAESMPVALSIFHTAFNLLNTLLLVWFVPLIIKAVNWMVKQKEDDEEFKLQHISTGLMSTDELSIIQARKETQVYARRIRKMFEYSRELILDGSKKKAHKLIEKIKKYEEISDRMEVEIASYLTRLNTDSISEKASEEINKVLYVISHIESIGDSCHNLARAVERQQEQNIQLTGEMIKNFTDLFELCNTQLEEMMAHLDPESRRVGNDIYFASHAKLQKHASKLQNEHFRNLKKGVYKCRDGIIYSDICTELINIDKYAYEINDQLAGVFDLKDRA